ncbi:MAG: glycosyltransferase [Ignavibacteriales bacterium]|nr:glycosyltransferase [Ignavibacteriales bacterium]
MTGQHTFSIVIPVLNEEKLLPGLLDNLSIITNSKSSVELIVADGGSSDNSVKICENRVDKNIDVSSEEVNNIASGRNSGAWAASGEILVFCNADVLFASPEALTMIIDDMFKSDQKLIAIATWVETFPTEEKLIDRLFHIFYNHYFRFLNTLQLGMGRGECIIVRSSDFGKIGGFNPELPAGEDFDLFNRLIKLGNVKYSNKIKVYESPRRFRKLGYLKVTSIWTLNALSIMFRKRSISKEWKQVR